MATLFRLRVCGAPPSVSSWRASTSGRHEPCAPFHNRISPRVMQRRVTSVSAGGRPVGPPAAAPAPPVYSMASEEEDPELAQYFKQHRPAAVPTVAEEARTLFHTARFGSLATLSRAAGTEGFPSGSVVEFVCDAQGRPVFSVSSLSPHTGDMEADGRCSLTVMAPGFQSLKDSRHTLMGRVAPVPAAEVAALREVYRVKYPDAFYVDFGDFKWFFMSEVCGGRSVMAFGRAAKFTKEDYLSAKPDPLVAFVAPVCAHMNGDHDADMVAMVGQFMGLPVDGAKMLGLDRLGIDFRVTRKQSTFKLRLPFPEPVEDRKSIKDAIVVMTKAARTPAPSS